jgi:hypothetical protein
LQRILRQQLREDIIHIRQFDLELPGAFKEILHGHAEEFVFVHTCIGPEKRIAFVLNIFTDAARMLVQFFQQAFVKEMILLIADDILQPERVCHFMQPEVEGVMKGSGSPSQILRSKLLMEQATISLLFTSAIFTRSCCMVSRSRMVTVSSSRVW